MNCTVYNTLLQCNASYLVLRWNVLHCTELSALHYTALKIVLKCTALHCIVGNSTLWKPWQTRPDYHQYPKVTTKVGNTNIIENLIDCLLSTQQTPQYCTVFFVWCTRIQNCTLYCSALYYIALHCKAYKTIHHTKLYINIYCMKT